MDYQAEQRMPPVVFTALKEASPNETDENIYKSWPAILQVAKQKAGMDMASIDPNVIAQQIRQSNKIAPKPQTDPSILQAAITGPKTTQLDPVQITAPRMPIESPEPVSMPAETNINTAQNPYANANFTPATLMNQFDPAAMAKAQADYDARRRTENQGNVFTGFMSGISGNAATEAARRKATQEDDLQRTVTAQKDRAAQATAGLAGAKSAMETGTALQNANVEKAKADILIAKDRAELISVLGDQETRQQLQGNDTPLAQSARVTARQQFVAAGYTPEQAVQMVPDRMTGLAAIQATQGIPGALKAQTENITAQKTAAGIPEEVAKGRIATGAANTYAAGVTAPRPAAVSDKLFTSDAQRAKALLDRAKENPAPVNNTAGLALPPGVVPTITAGGVTLSNPGAAAISTGNAARNLAQADATQAYNTTVRDAFQNTRDMLQKTYSGKGAEVIGRWTNAEQAALLNQLSYLSSINATALPPQLKTAVESMKAGQDWNGTFLGSLTGQQLNKMIDQSELAITKNIRAQESRDTGVGKGKSPAAAVAADVPPPTTRTTKQNAPIRNSKGWLKHTDAKGNQAYVSPDGKQVEEIK